MSEITLKAQRREPGRSNARSLRRQGIVPGVFYHHGEEPISLAATELGLRPLIYTAESHLVSLKFDDGATKLCVLKDVVFDPISDRPVHFDLQGVTAGETMKVEIPVVTVGKAAGQLEGGLVQTLLHKLEVECLPKNLPEHIEVDISALNIGDSIHVSDLSSETYTILASGDTTIVSVTPPRVASEDATQDAATEPEVIAKGKSEGE